MEKMRYTAPYAQFICLAPVETISSPEDWSWTWKWGVFNETDASVFGTNPIWEEYNSLDNEKPDKPY